MSNDQVCFRCTVFICGIFTYLHRTLVFTYALEKQVLYLHYSLGMSMHALVLDACASLFTFVLCQRLYYIFGRCDYFCSTPKDNSLGNSVLLLGAFFMHQYHLGVL